MRKLIVFFVAIIVLIVGVCVAVSLIVAGQPQNVVGSALTGLSDDLMERQELSAIMKAIDGGSIEIAFANNGAIPGIHKDISAGGKLYFSDDAIMAENVYLKYGDAMLSAGAYVSEDRFYVQNDSILGGAWGLMRGNTQKQFEKSDFYHTSGSDYALPKEVSVALSHLLSLYDDGVDIDLIEDIDEVSERYTRELWYLICEYATFTKETDEVRIGGERVDCRIVTVTLSDRAQKRVVKKLLDYWEDDKALLKLVETYGELIEDLDADLNEESELNVVKAYEDFIDQTIESFNKIVEEDDTDLEEIRLTVYTPKMSSTLLKLEASVGKNEVLELELGPKGLAEAEKIAISMGNDRLVYEIVEDSDEMYKATVRVEHTAKDGSYGDSDFKQTLVSVKVNREKHTFTVSLYDSTSLSGTYEADKKAVTIVLDKIVLDEETTLNPVLTLTLKDKDRMPKRVKDVRSVFEIDEDTVKAWEDKAREHELISSLFFRETLSGKYTWSKTATETFAATYEFTPSGTVTYTVAGYQMNGTYVIKGDQLTITYQDNPTLSGSHDFENCGDYIKIDSVIYNKQ